MFKKKVKPPEAKMAKPQKTKGEKKWLLWSLIGFTGILVITAVILFLQLKKPVTAPPPPKSRPKASPVVPEIKQVQGEGVCQVSFSLTEPVDLKCSSITLDPNDKSIEASDVRKLTALVAGGTTPYTHTWSVASNKDDKGKLSSTTTNPTNWTVPGSLDDSQAWTIKDTITDSSTTKQTTACSVELSYGGKVACYDDGCTADSDCEGDLRCQPISGVNRCVNIECNEDTDCACDEEKISCYDDGCTADSDCEGDLRCQPISGVNRCVNATCDEDIDCVCPVASPSPSPSPLGGNPSPSPIARVPGPELPEAGFSDPAVLGVSAGLLLVIFGLLF